MYEKIKSIEINCEEDLDKVVEVFKENKIDQYNIDCDIAFESCGYDVYYYCIAYVVDNELEMITGTYDCH
ncbi:hypothetical protein [Clostridium saccharoperbutylacetonicum]|uniref:hypothetical protein n=1 Tax=Clostridium saccharoperbutylacetonicum TaxID=36745 RepID=UPI0039EA900B